MSRTSKGCRSRGQPLEVSSVPTASVGARRCDEPSVDERSAGRCDAYRIAAAARSDDPALRFAELGSRLGRAVVQDGWALRAVGTGRDAVVAQATRARAGVAPRTGDEAVLLSARGTGRAASHRAFAVRVDVAVADGRAHVMRD